ncbi:hypothetical protein ERJ75_000360300 [Trypanosoma vivax]|uniref:Uncharacterized protein n=1 Tax=Trypanosoma vivax (strain Y486) TaxID=1055687 RepID=G0TUR8_TRYVY|nr:hypothetical protein TRVL_09889 [Trypanosoma vivax]KAH8617696.1 hypothetical protein ERJ75_000360300 [Trypanosoma vivax]CCC47704.1 conserved hypothetical protein [Trypanosoma vivax Y486]
MTVDMSLFLPVGTAPQLNGNGCIVHGARQSGKTSFAFQAVMTTVRNGGRVVVFCREQALYAKMPQPFTSWQELSDLALSRIEFAYVSSIAGVVQEVGSWLSANSVPTLLLVDDDGFADAGDVRRVALLLSMMENIVEWLGCFGQTFHYVLVTNSLPEWNLPEELPLAPFPLVWFLFTSSGSIHVRTKGVTENQFGPLLVSWDGRLILLKPQDDRVLNA